MGSRGPRFVLNNKNNYGTPGQHLGAWARGFRGPGFVLENRNNYGTPGQHLGAWALVVSEGRGSVFLGSRSGSGVCCYVLF